MSIISSIIVQNCLYCLYCSELPLLALLSTIVQKCLYVQNCFYRKILPIIVQNCLYGLYCTELSRMSQCPDLFLLSILSRIVSIGQNFLHCPELSRTISKHWIFKRHVERVLNRFQAVLVMIITKRSMQRNLSKMSNTHSPHHAFQASH